MQANFVEIMESIQGEGLLVGTRQVFLRFCGCNLRCNYCDTVVSLASKPYCSIFHEPGTKNREDLRANPLSIDEVSSIIKGFSSSWVSLTGGEPLLWSDYIEKLTSRLRFKGYKFLLETNGVLYEELEKCIMGIDMVSMDFKLPSATNEDCWDKHEHFLKMARVKPCYVKVVVTDNTDLVEIKTAFDIVRGVDKSIPVILQAVTPHNNVGLPSLSDLLKAQKIGLTLLDDVRILPQMHTIMGLI